VSIAEGPEASISAFAGRLRGHGELWYARLTHISMQLPGPSVNTQGCVAKVSTVYFCPGSRFDMAGVVAFGAETKLQRSLGSIL